jgi:hypothetical protein
LDRQAFSFLIEIFMHICDRQKFTQTILNQPIKQLFIFTVHFGNKEARRIRLKEYKEKKYGS